MDYDMIVAGVKDPGRAFLSGRVPAIVYWFKCRLELRTLVEHFSRGASHIGFERAVWLVVLEYRVLLEFSIIVMIR